MTHCYATAMLMAGMTPAFCAKQLDHSVEMFLTTYSKWIDGDGAGKGYFLPRTSSDEGKININR
ncbi:putative phage integrase [Burkholderia pseudomallei MSHR5613]|nr:putative phage integrase [Burkholderia pseudomallei MSHR5613]KGX15534.1 putative phage integrase [Burkholderia pseudomallei ABCPW 1]